MAKKLNRLEDWISASVAASLLSDKMGFPVDPKYISRLSRSKKQPVRTRSISGHKLYNKQDIQAATITRRGSKSP